MMKERANWRMGCWAGKVVGVVVLLLGLTLRADMSTWTEYFVSCSDGNDAWDGSAATWVGGTSTVGPKKTIQAAVALADGTGTIVTVAPGVYNEGGVATGGSWPCSNRVYIAQKNVFVRSSGGKEVTHIVGARDTSPNNWNGLGTNAVRCVAGTGDATVAIKGFTLRDGATGYDPINKKDGSARGGGARSLTLVDCVVTNCTAHRGAAGHGCRFVRCVITGNANANGGSFGDAGEASSYLNCLLTRNPGSYVVSQPSMLVNCTLAGNAGSKLVNSVNTAAHVANCVFVGNESSSVDYAKASVECCVANGNAVMATVDELTVTNAANFQYRSSLGTSWRLMADAEAVGRGKGSYLQYFDLPECEGGVYRDLNGTVIDPTSETIDAGCFQGNHYPVASSGSTIQFETDGVRVADFGDASAGDWIVSVAFPEMFRLKSASGTPAYSFYDNNTDVGYESSTVGYYQHFPDEDGWTRYVANPDRTALNRIKMRMVAAELYVDPVNGNDANDGSSAHPLRTLQAANDAATVSYTLVHAAPGIYAEGGVPSRTTDNGVAAAFSNRLCVTSRHIAFVSDTPRGAVIMGAPDPVTGTLGTNAMRCVAFTATKPSYTYLRGFDLTAGYTLEGPLDKSFFYAGAINAGGRLDVQVIDCVISNNFGYQGIVYGGTVRRSKILNNTVLNTAILRSSRAYDCVLAGNVAKSFRVAYVSELAGCTLNTDGKGMSQGHGSSSKTYMHASVVENCGSTDTGALSETPVASYLAAELDVLHFANPAAYDYRLSTLSPACNLVTPTDFAAINRWWQFFGLDAYGAEPVFTSDGCFAAGASRGTPLPYVVVEDSSGLTVTGATPGTNILADASATLTFDATTAVRPFDGLSTNGVLVTAAKTWSVTADALANGTEIGLHHTGIWYVDAAAADDSGNGFTPTTAKRTLVGAATNAVRGEVVRVAPGLYAEGTAKDSPTQATASRVVVPDGVTVESTGGRDVTFIRGASDTFDPDSQGNGTNAVRCAYLGTDSVLRGFTLTGGRTQYFNDKKSGGDFSGGGALGESLETSRVEDCVVYGCSAHSGAAGMNVLFMNSVISNNTFSSGNGANGGRSQIARACNFRNCLFDYTTSDNALELFSRVESCTFGPNLKMPVLYNPSGKDYPHVVNSVFLGSGKIFTSSSNVGVMTNCVFGPKITYPSSADYLTNGCWKVTADQLVFTDDYRPVVGSNVCVDAALPEFCTAAEKDVLGGPRVMNGVRDIGAVEADWRPRYAADLGYAPTVTAVSPAVVETAARAVRLPASTTTNALSLAVTSNLKMHRLTVRVTEGATLTFFAGDDEVTTFTAAEGEQNVRFRPQVAGETLRLVCTGESGYADLVALNRESGCAIYLR